MEHLDFLGWRDHTGLRKINFVKRAESNNLIRKAKPY